jgi:hypothetical protein
MSPGTISWWGAFMSNAIEVHYPMTETGSGRNRLNHDLHVDDEPRYHMPPDNRDLVCICLYDVVSVCF